MRAGTETRDGKWEMGEDDGIWERGNRKWEMGDNMGDLGICFCYLFIFKKGDN